jgi:ABC-type proline/glycine betaine transport system substrate-binding protein
MIGLGLSGNAQIFEQGANADDAELKQLRDRTQAEFGEIDPKATDTELETKLVNAHGIRTRVEQIRAKYAAVLADDDVRRAERRREVADKVNRSHPT